MRLALARRLLRAELRALEARMAEPFDRDLSLQIDAIVVALQALAE